MAKEQLRPNKEPRKPETVAAKTKSTATTLHLSFGARG